MAEDDVDVGIALEGAALVAAAHAYCEQFTVLLPGLELNDDEAQVLQDLFSE